MPLYEKSRSAIPLSQFASDGKTYSSRTDHLKCFFLVVARRGFSMISIARTTCVKSALGVEEVEKE